MQSKHPDQHSGFKLLTVNINGLSETSRVLLDSYLYTNKIGVAAISETKKDVLSPTVFHPKMTYHQNRSYNPSRQGGSAIVVNESIQSTELAGFGGGFIDDTWCVLKILNKTVLFGSIYVRPNCRDSEDALVRCINEANAFLKSHRCQELIIMGDLNSRNPLWGDHSWNSCGNRLAKAIIENNLYVLNDGQPTFTCVDDGSSVIDLCIVSEGLARMNPKIFVDYETELFTGAPNRGHYPIIFTLAEQNPINEPTPSKMRNWQETDWKRFQEVSEEICLNKQLQWLENSNNTEILWEITRDIMKEAAERIVPLKRTTHHSKPYWNPKLSKLSSELRRLRKLTKKRSDPITLTKLRQIKENFHSELQNAKSNWLEKETEALNYTTGQTFWRKYKKFFSKHSNSQLGVLANNGTLVTDDKERADILFRDFFSGTHLTSENFDDNFYQHVTQQIVFLSRSEEKQQNFDEISEYELEKALMEVNPSSKAEDPDGIHPAVLVHLGPRVKDLLLTLFNKILESSNWPFINNEVIFIPKSGKESYLKTSSYRPITKSSYVGKLLERILKNRIMHYLYSNDLDDVRQEGFRKRKSTARYITDLMSSIQLAWASSQNPVAVTVDLHSTASGSTGYCGNSILSVSREKFGV